MKLKKFNWSIFVVSTMAVGFLFIPAFLAAFARDEGTLRADDILGSLFAHVFDVMRFPTHTLLWPIISKLGSLAFFGGILINWMFYGLVMERVVSIFREWNSRVVNKVCNV